MFSKVTNWVWIPWTPSEMTYSHERHFVQPNTKFAWVWWYLGWLQPLPLCSQFLLWAPSVQQPLHFRPHQSTLSNSDTRVKVSEKHTWHMKSQEPIYVGKRVQDQKYFNKAIWHVKFSSLFLQKKLKNTTYLQETPAYSIPKGGETASPSLRSLCGASVSAGQWFQHLQRVCYTYSLWTNCQLTENPQINKGRRLPSASVLFRRVVLFVVSQTLGRWQEGVKQHTRNCTFA